MSGKGNTVLDVAEAMSLALELAERGRGWVEPNPMVGAVWLRGGKVIGQAYHEKFGGPHAEVNAIADARARSEKIPGGGTMVVTLEPCAHRGKTGPCAEALIEAGVERVVVAMVDPYEEVAGRGIEKLREAGAAVEVGLMEAEARRLNEAYIKRVTTGLPWVIVKWAQTLDGKTATATGHSQWISNEQSRMLVHRLRGRVDAIVVGVGTAIADDPSLTARPPADGSVQRVARRVVVDRSGRLPPDAKMRHDDGPPVTIISGGLREGLKQLAAEGVTNVLIEGGATLVGALLREGLVDQVLVFTAPKILGDAAAVPAVHELTCETIDEALQLSLTDVQRLGDDVVMDYRVDR